MPPVASAKGVEDGRVTAAPTPTTAAASASTTSGDRPALPSAVSAKLSRIMSDFQTAVKVGVPGLDAAAAVGVPTATGSPPTPAATTLIGGAIGRGRQPSTFTAVEEFLRAQATDNGDPSTGGLPLPAAARSGSMLSLKSLGGASTAGSVGGVSGRSGTSGTPIPAGVKVRTNRHPLSRGESRGRLRDAAASTPAATPTSNASAANAGGTENPFSPYNVEKILRRGASGRDPPAGRGVAGSSRASSRAGSRRGSDADAVSESGRSVGSRASTAASSVGSTRSRQSTRPSRMHIQRQCDAWRAEVALVVQTDLSEQQLRELRSAATAAFDADDDDNVPLDEDFLFEDPDDVYYSTARGGRGLRAPLAAETTS